ncbi:hypothetical protein JST97_26720 [bacterium]|nr:hypothetical protein [bacterium]
MRWLLIVLSLTTFCAAQARPAYHLPSRPLEAPALVEDEDPLCFRTARMMAEHYPGDVTGLAGLRMSGSAQPGRQTLAEILGQIPSSKVLIVDLRQECHAYGDDRLLTWSSEHNQANLGLDRDQVLEVERSQIVQASRQSEHEVISEEDYDNGLRNPELISVEHWSSEQELVREFGQDYLRLAVTDHLRPSDLQVDRFLQALESLPADGWVHFHCRAGVGRTSTFLALYDMLHNADRVSLNEILARQTGVAPGWNLNLVSTGSNRQWSQERYQFLACFYGYSQARLAGCRLNWSDWLKQSFPE